LSKPAQQPSRLSDQYTLKVKTGAGWKRFFAVRLMISVGSPKHEGEKFRATIDWINRNAWNEAEQTGIKKVIVSVNGVLQRHNFVTDCADGVALAQAMKMEQQWIATHRQVVKKINPAIDVRTIQWMEYIGDKDYVGFRNEIDAAYINIPQFAETVNADAQEFLGRQINRLAEEIKVAGGEEKASPELLARRQRLLDNKPKLITAGVEYILEELAAFAMMVEKDPAAEIYPGSNLRSAEFWIKNKPENAPERVSRLMGTERCFTRVDFSSINPT